MKSLLRGLLSVLLFLLTGAAAFGALEWKMRDLYAPPGDWIGAALMAFFVALALGAVRKWRRDRGDARLAADDSADRRDGARVCVAGTLQPLAATLRSPFTGQECVAYEYEIQHFVHRNSQNGGNSSWSMDRSGVGLAPCAVRTSTGDVRLLGYPGFRNVPWTEIGDKDPVRRYVESAPFEPGRVTAALSMIDTRQAEVRKDWRVTDYDDLASSKVTELFVRPGEPVCVIGLYSAADNAIVPGGGGIRLIAATREKARELLGDAGLSDLLGAAFLILLTLPVWGVLNHRERYLEREGRGHSLRDIRHEALIEATTNGELDEMRQLLARGADANGRETDGSTALFRVTQPAAAGILLDAGADVNAADKDGFTPLMRAAADGNLDLIRVYLAHRAALDRRDTSRHLTARGFAELNDQAAAAKILGDAGEHP